jgi:type IV pilus assembly protein PilE
MRIHNKAFTLIELVIVVAIVVILALVALNLYSSNVLKGRRTDGLNAILAISLAQERYRSNNSQYGTLAQAWGGVSASPQGYYTLSISNVSSTGYTITATAVGNQATDAVDGISCTTLQLSVANGTLTKSPSACWPN